MNFNVTRSDTCLFINSNDDDVILLATYVDDLLIASRSLDRIKDFETRFAKHLQLKLLGDAQYILGWKISDHKDGIVISQEAYTKRVLEKFGMTNCHPVRTPSLKEQQQIQQVATDEDQSFPYRQLVGTLMYLANSTRPDIAQATHHSARFVSNPSPQNITGIKRILRYLKGTMNHGVLFRNATNLRLTGYCDADFAGDYQSDSRSTTGYIFFTNGPIVWSSRRQTLTALSTTEAEINALAEASKQAIALSNLLMETQLVTTDVQVTIHEDNASCLALVNGSQTRPRTRHIATRIGFVRDLIASNAINVISCPTANMLADPLTKPLGATDFRQKLSTIMVTSDVAKIDDSSEALSSAKSSDVTDQPGANDDDDDANAGDDRNSMGAEKYVTRSRESVESSAPSQEAAHTAHKGRFY